MVGGSVRLQLSQVDLRLGAHVGYQNWDANLGKTFVDGTVCMQIDEGASTVGASQQV